MTVRQVLKMGHPLLLQTAAPVVRWDDPDLEALVVDLWDTLAVTGGVGLAAPQIGVSLQVVVFGFDRSARYPDAPPVPRTVLVNPEILPLADSSGPPQEESGWEGCLSVPGLRGWVPRWRRILYRGRDASGRWLEREAEGFHARLVQHECDHLIGRLYPTRMADLTRLGFVSELFPDLEDTAAVAAR
ncbi:peptide deformylase [Ideonella livida]|uniref:Peptide deformylase n=1 Tax=Ideonella livida TaxID=2707176 RepID=A0A7C9PG23_9BURK|nr:peptide deformylase [Ideonella livida]NDY90769.1 peptide deformylase [Ideonella livida]